MARIRPLMSHRYHLPPSAHTTFVADRFVVCTFAPRPFETDPGAIKVPFFHNNDDYDEVIFYHAGDFFSRDNIQPGMMTFHPCGFTHGPHPKAFAAGAKAAKTMTDEVAVMIDARPSWPTPCCSSCNSLRAGCCAPFVGVSLATWTCIIGVFLAGISLGNWLGGRLADRGADEGTLRSLLLLGAGTILLSLGIIWLLGDGHVLRSIPLYPRLLLLTLTTCLPPALVLSLISPVAIKLQLPDVAHAGRVVGLVYALGTAGSLAGNFLTGYVLLARLTTYSIVLGAAGVLVVVALVVRAEKNLTLPAPLPEAGRGENFRLPLPASGRGLGG